MLLKQKNDQRQKELDIFKTKAGNKEDLFKELKEIDNKIKAKEDIAKIEETLENGGKGLEMYRKLRDQILTDLQNNY